MSAKWLSNSSTWSVRGAAALEAALRGMGRPDRVRRLRQLLLVLCALWAVLGLSRLIWSLLPASEVALPDAAVIINPQADQLAVSRAETVDIERMTAWHLFGEAGAPTSEQAVVTDTVVPNAREGIERGARMTRLDLKLKGVVASTAEGLGYAIIEYKSTQALYGVEDKLPVPGQVVLAKVMPAQVVLDNGGTYELLQLFEESSLDAQLPPQPASSGKVPAAPGGTTSIDKRTDTGATAVARSYRERLYQNPQSLAEVVTVSAVRENGELLGYRLEPARDRQQFELLGFKPGDLVLAVNGIAMNDPANTMRLYQAMRSASEAVFELERNKQALTVSVSLDGGTARR